MAGAAALGAGRAQIPAEAGAVVGQERLPVLRPPRAPPALRVGRTAVSGRLYRCSPAGRPEEASRPHGIAPAPPSGPWVLAAAVAH
eukprot:CAMPEP_0170211198 /NCGR_PEP_ID=MMETSP0116_2-20130129/5214_1 /TAXON_ID=400756 /ORGANISM="Durinskia baltica, Strain CSIRO CS-38" /LENGTH=85 /DNA_ID=CAMNT_0010461731 /DNA_START=145 /DNA_END=403 /DNA_ORIENTATION=-